MQEKTRRTWIRQYPIFPSHSLYNFIPISTSNYQVTNVLYKSIKTKGGITLQYCEWQLQSLVSYRVAQTTTMETEKRFELTHAHKVDGTCIIIISQNIATVTITTEQLQVQQLGESISETPLPLNNQNHQIVFFGFLVCFPYLSHSLFLFFPTSFSFTISLLNCQGLFINSHAVI